MSGSDILEDPPSAGRTELISIAGGARLTIVGGIYLAVGTIPQAIMSTDPANAVTVLGADKLGSIGAWVGGSFASFVTMNPREYQPLTVAGGPIIMGSNPAIHGSITSDQDAVCRRHVARGGRTRRGPATVFSACRRGVSAGAAVARPACLTLSGHRALASGLGNSPLLNGMGIVDDLAYLYLDLATELGLDDAVLVAACFGGWVAAEIMGAVDRPLLPSGAS